MTTKPKNTHLPLEQALEEQFAARQPETGFARRLEAQLLEQHQELQATPQTPHAIPTGWLGRLFARPALALVTVLAALLLLSGTVYAVARLSGFLPGIGFVNEVQGVLPEPVVVTDPALPAQTAAEPPAQAAQPLQITVAKAVIADNQFQVVFTISGLPLDYLKDKTAVDFLSGSFAQVRLPDGSYLENASGSQCGGRTTATETVLECQFVKSLNGREGTEFTLVIPQLPSDSSGQGVRDWEIPLHLSEPALGIAGVDNAPGVESANAQSISLRLDRAVQNPGETAFLFTVTNHGEPASYLRPSSLRIQDEQGRYYLADRSPSAGPDWDPAAQTAQIAVVTYPLQSADPLTFTLDAVYQSNHDPVALTVSIPAGAGVGSAWKLAETVTSMGTSVQFVRAELVEGLEGGVDLRLFSHSDPSIRELRLSVADSESSTSTSGWDTETGLLVTQTSLPSGAQGEQHLVIYEIVRRVDGPWTLKWTPLDPAQVGTLAATPAPERVEELQPIQAGDPLFAELDTNLVAAFPAELYQPGWTVVREESETVAAGQPAFTTPQPARQILETWREIDPRGFVLSQQTIRRTAEGQFLSMDWTKGLWHFYLPEPFVGQGSEVYLSVPDYSLRGLLRGVMASDGRIARETRAADDQTLTVYTLSYPAYPDQGFAGPLHLVEISFAADGRLLTSEFSSQTVSGSRELLSRTTYLSAERADGPSAEVQGYFDQVILPR